MVTHEGDTLTGLLRANKDFEKVHFKPDKEAVSAAFSAMDISAFGLNVSRTILVDSLPTTVFLEYLIHCTNDLFRGSVQNAELF